MNTHLMDNRKMTTTGDRLNYLLDVANFKTGRGRIPAFQSYLQENVESLESLKYSTVRSWFNNHAPPMQRLSAIVDRLHKDYAFEADIGQIKAWWKLGGKSPFPSPQTREEKAPESDKLNFLVTSLVTSECGLDFKQLPSSTLLDVKNKAIDLAKDYADPRKVDIPIEILRIFIAKALEKTSI